MKVSNPTPLTLGWIVGKVRPPQWSATFILKGQFKLSPNTLAWSDEPPVLSGDVHVDDDRAKPLLVPSDFAPQKLRADILMNAVAYSPGKQPAGTWPVSLRVGAWSKSLVVYGERTWKRGVLGAAGATSPTLIAEVPIAWDRAFGGPGYSKNPIGRGWKSDAAPQIESPNRTVTGMNDSADPAGFGPVAPTWLPRSANLGTYDDAWRKTRWPWFPDDFDWSHFNAAPRDQQIEGYLTGDEEIELLNLHPETPRFVCRLPGLRPRCFVQDQGSDRPREASLVLDTLLIDVPAGLVTLVWRGRLDVKSVKLREVAEVFIGLESLGEKPRPVSSHRPVAGAPAREAAPVPPSEAAPDRFALMNQRLAQMDRDFKRFEQEMALARQQAESELASHRAALLAAGVSLTTTGAPPPLGSAATSFDIALAELRATDPVRANAIAAHRPWIDHSERQLAHMDGDMSKIQADLAAKKAALLAGQPRAWTREEVEAAASTGGSFEGQNLTGLDLSGLTLSRLNLRNAVMTRVNLTGSKLNGADLRGADLSNAKFDGASLNLAHLDGADLTGATFSKATLLGATFAEVTAPKIDLSGLDLTGGVFDRANLAEANLTKSRLDQARFIQANLTGARLDGARLVGACLERAVGDQLSANEIMAEGADFSGFHGSGASLKGANLRKIKAAGAIFDGAILDGADFTAASLSRAQFSDASLRGTRFELADLRQAMMDDACMVKAILTKANLLRASFDRADLTDADLRGVNAFEAGFWETTIVRTNLRDANLKGSLLRD